MRTPPLGRAPVTNAPRRSVLVDAAVSLLLLAVFFAILKTGAYWMGRPLPEAEISLSARALPLYAFYSVMRIAVAYVLSLLFAVGYGYVAAYNPRVESWLIAVLDILQSIPVLSFLPGVMLAMMALIPSHQLGIELGSIILIFTGQVWNMAFSFYSSLKSIPREMIEATRINRFSAWQRFWQLELPFAAIGLIWNSIMSVAGGWFALIACETFPLGNQNFRLPGLGSYLQAAAFADPIDGRALTWGLVALVVIIVATDQLVWRPLIAWSDKFKMEQVEAGRRIGSPILTLLSRPSAVLAVPGKALEAAGERITQRLARVEKNRVVHAMDNDEERKSLLLPTVLGVAGALFVAWGGIHAWELVRGASAADLKSLALGAVATWARVNAALIIAALWTIPVGVAIGSNPRLAPVVQPITQLIASIPASAFFPPMMLVLATLGASLGWGSILLMLLGTQWYILFNVIAGAMAIPSDLKEAAAVYRFTRVQRWRRLILPGIFPYLVTGMVTASGGAWNASILAEYGLLGQRTFRTVGLGAEITAALASNNLATLVLATILMAAIVVTTNRLVWRRAYRLAETRYKLEG